MKKRIRSLAFTLVAAALLTLLPRSNVLTVKADGPETYSVAYIEGNYNEWRYQPGSVFDEPKGHGPLVELLLKLKDGDSVVVYQVGAPIKTLDLGSVKLGNLTVYQNVRNAIIFTGGVKDCYVLAGAFVAINGDVTAAYVYDAPKTDSNATQCSFNNNVIDMYLYMTRNPATSISCGGTVGHFHATYADNGDNFAERYDIHAGQLIVNNGLILPELACGSGPSDEYLQAKGESEKKTESVQAPSTGKNTSDEYDKVPKTGDSDPVFWLLLASAACFGGSFLLRKKELCK